MIYCIFALWTIGSVWYFLIHMGDKYRKDKWYDWFLLAPVLLISYVVGFVLKLARDKG